MNAPVYVDIDQGIHKGKLKNALNEKRKKLRGFSFSINMANFEAFCRTKKLISNLFFLKSEYVHVGPTQVKCRHLISSIFYVRNFRHFLEMLEFTSLFKKKRFEINFFVQQNASKFPIFIEKENPGSFVRFSFRATLSFTL